MGAVAKRVFCIEANPAWSHAFVEHFYAEKPKNVSFLFGAADEFAGQLAGDVALFCAYSGSESLYHAAGMFAPVVIDVFCELVRGDPRQTDQETKDVRAEFLWPIAPLGNVWRPACRCSR